MEGAHRCLEGVAAVLQAPADPIEGQPYRFGNRYQDRFLAEAGPSTKAMREAGFMVVPMGKGGPGIGAGGNPAASTDDKRRARELNAEWDTVRIGAKPRQRLDRPIFPDGSVGHAYHRVMKLREAERLQRRIVWTSEQKSRDDWLRAWKWIGPKFGDCDLRTIQPEHFLRIDPITGKTTGLLPDVEAAVSISGAASCSQSLAQSVEAHGRDEAQQPTEALLRPRFRSRQSGDQQRARSAAGLMAAPRGSAPGAAGTAHGLLPAGHLHRGWPGLDVLADRCPKLNTLSGSAGRARSVVRARPLRRAATLSPWSLVIPKGHVQKLGADIAPNAPIFRNRSGATYSKDTLGDDFRAVRETFDKTDMRQLADMRRSGAIEGDAGGGSIADQSTGWPTASTPTSGCARPTTR